MLRCGCEPSYEGGYGDDGRSARYSMTWCPLHAAAGALLAALQEALPHIRGQGSAHALANARAVLARIEEGATNG